jgi:hypothetical protein
VKKRPIRIGGVTEARLRWAPWASLVRFADWLGVESEDVPPPMRFVLEARIYAAIVVDPPRRA